MELHRPLYMCGSFVKHKENGQEQVHHPLNVNEECQGEKYCVTLTNQKHGRESSRSHTHFNAFECTVSTHTHTHTYNLWSVPMGAGPAVLLIVQSYLSGPGLPRGVGWRWWRRRGVATRGEGVLDQLSSRGRLPGEQDVLQELYTHARTHAPTHARTHTHTLSLSLSLSLSAGTHLKQESTATSRLAANKTRLHCPGWGHNVPRPRSCQLVTADNGTHTQSMCGGEREKKKASLLFLREAVNTMQIRSLWVILGSL